MSSPVGSNLDANRSDISQLIAEAKGCIAKKGLESDQIKILQLKQSRRRYEEIARN